MKFYMRYGGMVLDKQLIVLINSLIKDNEALMVMYNKVIYMNRNIKIKSIFVDILKEKAAQKNQLINLIGNNSEEYNAIVEETNDTTLSNIIGYETNIQNTYLSIARYSNNSVISRDIQLIILSQNFTLQMLNHLHTSLFYNR